MSNKKYVQGTITINNLKNPEKYIGRIKDNITFRSSLEKSFMKYCDENENIIAWRSEEDIVYYISPLDKRKHRYFVDFYIKFKNHKGKIKESLVEVKPFDQSQNKPYISEGMSEKSKKYSVQHWSINQAKWAAAKNYAAKRQMSFHIVTDRDFYYTTHK